MNILYLISLNRSLVLRLLANIGLNTLAHSLTYAR